MRPKHGPTWRPQPPDYGQILSEQNPWWISGQVPAALSRRVERPLSKFLWRRLIENDPRRFQLILGPRRVGKTTGMYQTVGHLLRQGVASTRLCWLRLDHPLLMEVNLGDLARMLMEKANATASQPLYLFLDELTYAKEWDLWLKTFYDEQWPLVVVGTSSATAALRHRRLESGVGRWEEQYLAPYSFGEYLELVGRAVAIPVRDTLWSTIQACGETGVVARTLDEHRRRFLLTGGFPELLLRESRGTTDEASLLLESQRTLRSDAVERAIYKDIPQAFGGVENPMMLERVLYTLAGQVTGILSPQALCQGLDGLSRPTFDRYLRYLELAFLVFTLPNYSGSEASRQKRGRKLYFVDAAVRNAALQRGIGPLSDTAEMGLLMEYMAAGHLYAMSQQSQARLYHWRDGNDEVDLVYDRPESPMAFEIGSSVSHHRGGLHAFVARFKRFGGRCFIVAPDAALAMPQQTRDGIGTLPLDLFLLAVSAQAEAGLESRISVAGGATARQLLMFKDSPPHAAGEESDAGGA